MPTFDVDLLTSDSHVEDVSMSCVHGQRGQFVEEYDTLRLRRKKIEYGVPISK
jgi:hypothetical protein